MIEKEFAIILEKNGYKDLIGSRDGGQDPYLPLSYLLNGWDLVTNEI